MVRISTWVSARPSAGDAPGGLEPVSPGMRMSMRTTSGARAVTLHRLRPSPASPTTSMSSAVRSSTENPARTRAWSSTTTTRITAGILVVGDAGIDTEAAIGGGPDVERSAVDGDPLAHADQAVAAGSLGRPPCREPSSDTTTADCRPVARRAVRSPGALGVAQRVGERLLHDAVRRQLDAGRQVRGAVRDVQVDGQPGVGHLVGQAGRSADPGVGVPSPWLTAAHQAEDRRRISARLDRLVREMCSRARRAWPRPGSCRSRACRHPPGRR